MFGFIKRLMLKPKAEIDSERNDRLRSMCVSMLAKTKGEVLSEIQNMKAAERIEREDREFRGSELHMNIIKSLEDQVMAGDISASFEIPVNEIDGIIGVDTIKRNMEADGFGFLICKRPIPRNEEDLAKRKDVIYIYVREQH